MRPLWPEPSRFLVFPLFLRNTCLPPKCKQRWPILICRGVTGGHRNLTEDEIGFGDPLCLHDAQGQLTVLYTKQLVCIPTGPRTRGRGERAERGSRTVFLCKGKHRDVFGTLSPPTPLPRPPQTHTRPPTISISPQTSFDT